MRKILFLLIAVILANSVIAKDIELIQFADLRLRDKQSTLYNTWDLGGEHNFATGVRITIDSDRISGSDGCNSFSATLMVASKSLKVGPIMSTRMQCGDLNGADQAFTQALSTVAKYDFNEAGQLELLNSSGDVVLLLIQ